MRMITLHGHWTRRGRRSPPTRPFPLPPPADLAKKLALDPNFPQNLEDEDRTIRAMAAKAARERSRPSTAPDKPPGSRHTSRVELHPTHRVSKALPAVPQMTSANSNDRSSTPTPSSPASEAPSPYTWKRIDCNGPPMPADHYLLRLAISVLLKTLTPYIRGPEFATKEKNGEVKRIAADNLAILTRMEKTWNGDWTRAVVAGLERKEEEEDIRQNLRMADVGDRAKERERTSFTTALLDGVLLCLYVRFASSLCPADLQVFQHSLQSPRPTSPNYPDKRFARTSPSKRKHLALCICMLEKWDSSGAYSPLIGSHHWRYTRIEQDDFGYQWLDETTSPHGGIGSGQVYYRCSGSEGKITYGRIGTESNVSKPDGSICR
jgi:hypothetical protein